MESLLRALLATTFLAALPAGAQSLGDIDVRSSLGEPLDGRIPVSAPPGAPLRAECFRISFDAASPAPLPTAALERAGGATILRIRSSSPVGEPALRLRVKVGCFGEARAFAREYAVLLDPPPGAPDSGLVGPGAGTVFSVREGDTLAGYARAIFPRHDTARRLYVAALRERNPSIAALGDEAALDPGISLALPDLRAFANDRRLARSAGGARAGRIADVPRHPFLLRVSAGPIDLERIARTDERARSELRQRRFLLDAEDPTTAVVVLGRSLAELEGRLRDLQLKLERPPRAIAMPASAAATAGVPPPTPGRSVPQESPLAFPVHWALPAALAAALAALLVAYRRRAARDREVGRSASRTWSQPLADPLDQPTILQIDDPPGASRGDEPNKLTIA